MLPSVGSVPGAVAVLLDVLPLGASDEDGSDEVGSPGVGSLEVDDVEDGVLAAGVGVLAVGFGALPVVVGVGFGVDPCFGGM